jgi:hypothetical protein
VEGAKGHIPGTPRREFKGGSATGFTLVHLHELPKRDSWIPVRDHPGIGAFGVNAWTGHAAGDRILNEHDESDEETNEERYFVLRGRAAFEFQYPLLAANLACCESLADRLDDAVGHLRPVLGESEQLRKLARADPTSTRSAITTSGELIAED